MRSRKTTGCTVLLAVVLMAAPAFGAESVGWSVQPDKVTGSVDVKIYGQFLEHIFNSVHGGLWGDLLRNGSLEPNAGKGSAWAIKDGIVATTHRVTNQPIVFGDPAWADYEITLEARKEEGAEGFLVLFRATDRDYCWVNFGGWGNKEHGIEKTGADKRVPGTIETGRWYRVRVRCEGNRFSAFLDDQLVLEVNSSRARPKGRIGLNTWESRASFRNIKVTSLDGKVVFEGLPAKSDLQTKPAYWSFYGLGDFTCEAENAVGPGTSIKVAPGKGEAGLVQAPLCVRGGEAYKGSVYLKGEAKAGVIVRIKYDAGEKLSETVIKDVTAEWKKFEFSFRPERTANAATIQIAVQDGDAVSIDRVSLFQQAALDAGGFRPDVLKAIADLKPGTIRYPGGCFASAYRWKHGIGPQEKRTYYPNVIWDDRDPNQMGTDEFIDLCRRVGAEPIIAINMAAGVEETLDWLEYCNGDATTTWGKVRAENGHPQPYNVRYWEIDNETWGMGPEKYADVVIKFSRALRAKDPTLKIIACGGYGYDDGKGSSNGWNQKLLDKAAKDFDYLSIHYYNGICYAQDFTDDPRRYEAYKRDEIGGMIARSANPAIRIYCSEWGMMNDDWRSGLYTGGILNAFERQSELVPMSCPAVWLQTVSNARPRPRWASCLILYDQSVCYGAPTWVVEKLWRENFQPKRVALQGPDRPLDAVAMVSEDGKTLCVKVVNPQKDAVPVRLDVAGPTEPSEAKLLLVSADEKARNTLEQPQAIAPKPGDAKREGRTITFAMPPLSAGVLTVKLR